jgi:hypothetical protein
MELRAASYGGASNLFMEMGQQRCLSMAHCEFLRIPWQFDFYIPPGTSWEKFDTRNFGNKKTGAQLHEAFQRKLSGADPIPSSIEQYLSAAGTRLVF